MLMSLDEFYDIMPNFDPQICTIPMSTKISGLYNFIQFLNPAYLCRRAEFCATSPPIDNLDHPLTFLQYISLRDTVRSWNTISAGCYLDTTDVDNNYSPL